MAENSGIEWCDHTFNSHMGCTKVSPACKNCYAERDMDKRYNRVAWGPNGTRVLTSDANWQKPVRWSQEANADYQVWRSIACGPSFGVTAEVLCDSLILAGHTEATVATSLVRLMDQGAVSSPAKTLFRANEYARPRVFCASLADVFESWDGPIVDSKRNQVWHSAVGWISAGPGEQLGCVDRPVTMDDVRKRLFGLIDATPNLDWLILTKRPENIFRMWPGREGLQRNWAGEQDVRGDNGRVMPYRKNVWIGCSVENQEYADKRIPELLGCRDLSPVLWLSCEPLLGPVNLRSESIYEWCQRNGAPNDILGYPAIDWVVCGGESGPCSRSMDLGWVRSLKSQCDASGVPFFMKQLSQGDTPAFKRFEEFPVDLQVRQFPACTSKH